MMEVKCSYHDAGSGYLGCGRVQGLVCLKM